MTKTPLTRSLKSLKREAKALKKAKACKLHEALDELARHYGFGNWALLHQQHPETLAQKSRTASVKPEEIREWFLDNHEQDISNPFDSDSIVLPNVDVRLVLERRFPKAAAEVLDEVALELEENGDWVSLKVIDAINWFQENHELAVNCSPYESREGGYLYPLVDVSDVINDNFGDLPEEDIEGIVQAIESYDDAWVDRDFLNSFSEEDPSLAEAIMTD